MPFDFQQYQIKTEPPPAALSAATFFESNYHQPWSEPVRVKIVPRLAVALIASGLFAPVLEPNKQIIQFYESRWHQAWSEPVRVRPRLRAALNPDRSSFYDILPRPGNQIQGWFQHWREPVWPKKGFKSQFQQTFTAPVRYLPPANITLSMLVTEANNDDADFEVFAFTTPPSALDLTAVNVSIEEIPDGDAANASIEES